MIIAFVREQMEADVVRALHQVNGLTGATFTRVRGFGRGRQRSITDTEELFGTARRVRVEVMVADELEDTVVRVIADTANTGNRGDGKVYVVELNRALRISTGEEGADGV